jgi:hypothetical protein
MFFGTVSIWPLLSLLRMRSFYILNYVYCKTSQTWTAEPVGWPYERQDG